MTLRLLRLPRFASLGDDIEPSKSSSVRHPVATATAQRQRATQRLRRGRAACFTFTEARILPRRAMGKQLRALLVCDHAFSP